MKLGQRVKKLRKSLGLTQREFAQRIPGKLDYSYIGKIERGNQYPSLKMLDRIGKAFSVPLGYFFEDDSFIKSLDLLPGEIRDLLKDRKRLDLLKMSRGLDPEHLDVVMQLIKILRKEEMRYKHVLARRDCYGKEKGKDDIFIFSIRIFPRPDTLAYKHPFKELR